MSRDSAGVILRAWSAVACASLALSGASRAQEAMYTQAATMPSPGVFVVRPSLHFERFGAEPDGSATRTDRVEWATLLQVGLVRDLSLIVDVPLAWERRTLPGGGRDSDRGVEDFDAMLKWRFFKDDTGGVDTVRAALLVGTHIPSGDDHDFSTQSFNPHIGAVVTVVRGRHGFNQDVVFQWNTGGGGVDNLGGGMGPSEALTFNSSYLFRVYPDEYTPESRGAWYLTAELNGIYETNGDAELRVAPGFMYEGWAWAFEAMAQLPVWSDLDERADLEFAIGVGLRFTF